MINLSETLASTEKLGELYEQTETELKQIQPRIDELEKQLSELKELKLAKQRLLTLKMSLSALLDSTTKDDADLSEMKIGSTESTLNEAKLYSFRELSTLKTFHPDEALNQVASVLKQKSSLNYEMFKAVVFKGGKASTEDIKAFLVESGAKQPQTGEGFEAVPLTEISSRANYLVRKGILQPAERGEFYSLLGWVDPE